MHTPISKTHTHKKVHNTTKRGYSKHKRFETIAERVKYTVPLTRVKESKSHVVRDFRFDDGSQADYPTPVTFDEHRELLKARKAKKDADYQAYIDAGGTPRKYSLRKQFLYHRNRRILESAPAILVIQPGSDAEFYDIMTKLVGHWETAHFRNGLVHVHDKPYAKLKEFFKGPVRVLLQKDATKIFPAINKLKRVLKDHPNTFFLGGAIDGFAGVAKDFEELKSFESKLHIQQQLISTLSGINGLIPTLEYPTKNLGMVMNHHGKEVEKNAV